MRFLTVEVLLVVFVASLVRSVFGFGEALIAVPLLALILPVQIAVPLAVLISIAIAAMVVAQDWRKIHLRSTTWLFLPTLAGIPLGIGLLKYAHQDLIKVILAAVILLFSGYSLLGRRPLHLEHDSRAWMLSCGFLAGVLGGAYGMNGPPLVVYGCHAPLVAAALSRHPAGLFPACKRHRRRSAMHSQASGRSPSRTTFSSR